MQEIGLSQEVKDETLHSAIRVSEFGLLYVRMVMNAEQDGVVKAFIVPTYVEALRLLKRPGVRSATLYVGGTDDDDDSITLRRVTAIRTMPDADLVIFELGDREALLAYPDGDELGLGRFDTRTSFTALLAASESSEEEV